MAIALQERDYEIFNHMATFGFVTVNQLCALLNPNGQGPVRDLTTVKKAIYVRLANLQREGLISSAPAPSLDRKTIKAYFITARAASLLSDMREFEYLKPPRWLEKKSHFVWVQGPHDIAACNFIANLVALARLDSSFSLGFWSSSRDCRFYVDSNDTTRVFNPDLYFDFHREDQRTLQMFVEMDSGHVNLPAIRRKALRAFQYVGGGKYKKDLDIEKFPRTLFITNCDRRLTTVAKEFQNARERYNGERASLIRKFPMWLATFEDVGIYSTDRGMVTDAPLRPVWKTLDGDTGVTPFEV